MNSSLMRFLDGAYEGYGGSRQSHGGARGGHRFSSRCGTCGGLRSSSSSSRHSRSTSSPSPIPTSPTQVETPVTRNSPVKDGVSFAEVVQSSPLQCHPQSLSSSKTSSSFKRRRSPDSGEVCKRCLRSGHKVDGCRHQLTCWTYSGIGHFAIRCLLRSPPRASTAFEKAPPSY